MKSRDTEIVDLSAQARTQKKIGLPSLLPKLRTTPKNDGKSNQSKQKIKVEIKSGFVLCREEKHPPFCWPPSWGPIMSNPQQSDLHVMMTVSFNTTLVAILFCGVAHQNRASSSNVESRICT